jgi:hypothetical protein
MGTADARPVVQILSLADKSVQTVPGIYGNDSQVVQIIKIPELEALEVVLRRKGPFKTRETVLLTVDLQGNLLRELKLEEVGDSGEEMLDGLLLGGDGYAQTLIGAYGKELRNDYAGMYLSQINEFGEQSTGLYTLADFPNFYNYLPEKQKIKQQQQLAAELEKGKLPSIRNTYAIRDVKVFGKQYPRGRQVSPSFGFPTLPLRPGQPHGLYTLLHGSVQLAQCAGAGLHLGDGIQLPRCALHGGGQNRSSALGQCRQV